MTTAPDRRRRIAVLAVAVVALAAAVAGIVVGRATKSTTTTASGPSWQPLPAAPIPGRVYEGVVWTGREMIVAGGVGRNGRVLADGAAYDPKTRTWHTIAPAPAGVRLTAPAAAWTGRTAVFWAGNAPDGPTVGAVYDPRADAWRRLPTGPLGPRELYSSVWTGKELLIISGARGDALASPVAAAVNPATGSWRLLPALNRLTGLLANGALWDGRDALVMGNLSLCPERGSACQHRRPIFVAYDPAGDATRELKLPAFSSDFGADTAASLRPIAWTGTEAVFSADVPGSARILRYNPATGVWRKGKTAPCYIPLQFTQTAWLGDRYAAACGTDGLQIYNPATDTWTWRTITPGPSPLNNREGSAIAWTGSELIAWSGSADRRFNPNPIPADGASLALKD